MIDDEELVHLRRCVRLATEALDAGDGPFGSVLVGGDGSVLAEARNEESSAGDATRHPEFTLARWAAEHLSLPARAAATVYTSGEHCPMCAAAHGWVGLGRIVYAVSAARLVSWLHEWGVPDGPVRTLPVRDVAPGVVVDGPVAALEAEMRALHRRSHGLPPSPPGLGAG